MARLTFTEFEEFVEALRGVQGHYLPTRHSTRAWQLRILELGDATVMTGVGGAPNIYHGVCLPDYVCVLLPLSQPDAIVVEGNALARDAMAWFTPDREFEFRALVPTRWMAINLGREMVRARLEDGDVAMPGLLNGNRIFSTERPRVAETISLARRAFRVDTRDPRALDPTSARDNLSHQLLEKALRCLAVDEIDDTRIRGRPRVDRRAVLNQALAVIEQRMHRSLYVEELCRAARVSSRTLHTVFVDHYGMSPHRYLALRRLCAIRDALRAAGPEDTVQSICARFGVWDFGRFASQYQRLFGVLPSEQSGRKRVERAAAGH